MGGVFLCKYTGMIKPKVLVILGPTATGKSSLAISVAKKFSGEIISADSRQVYKGMNLGTGKVTKKEMDGIPHHMLDVVSPNTLFSVSKYKKLAEKEIEKIIAKKKLPIICGGTGFYIDSIVKNIELPQVPPNDELRKKLEKKSPEALFKILEKLSPSRARDIDKHNKVRLIRAIEIAKALGHIPQIKEVESKYDFVFIGLDMDDNALKNSISRRLQARIKLGMINEVKKLHQNGVSWKRLESFGLEYRQISHYLQNKITLGKMVTNLESEIRHYAKRQRTWFKRNGMIQWFKPGENKKIISFVKKNI